MNPLYRLIAYARPYGGRFAAAIVAMLIYAAANAGVTYQIKPMIDGVLNGSFGFTLFAAAVMGGYLLKGIGAYFGTFLMTDIGQKVVRDVRNQLFRHTIDQSASFFSRRSTGQLLSRITNDVNQIQQAVSETLGDLLREGLSLVGFGALLFILDWRLALVTVFIAPLAIHPLIRFGKRIRSTTRRSQEELEHLTHVTAEAFTGHRIVKAFGAEAHEEGRFRRAAHQVYRTNLRVTRTLAILPSLMELLGGAATVLLIWYGSRQITACRRADRRRVHDVRRGGVHDVHAGQETEPRQRQPAAGDGRLRADLPGARHAFRGQGTPRCAGASPAAPRDRVPERGLRIRRPAEPVHPA